MSIGTPLLAYSWMRLTNPKFFGPKVISDWRYIFNDPNTPYGAKAQLTEMEKYGIPLTDAHLFFYEMMMVDGFTSQRKVSEACSDVWKHTDIINKLYSIIQLDKIPRYQPAYKIVLNLTHRILDVIHFSMDELVALCLMLDDHSLEDHYMETYAVVAINESLDHSEHTMYKLDRLASRCNINELIQRVDERCLREWLLDQFVEAAELLADVPIVGGRFTSLNKIREQHDKIAQAEIERLLEDEPKLIRHHPRFAELCDEHNFKLPVSRNTFIERGMRHHNCVANYYERHVSNPYSVGYCRLLFTTDYTVELAIEVRHNTIVAVRVIQCKGRNNKDFDQDIELTRLRVALTGEPEHILRVQEEENV